MDYRSKVKQLENELAKVKFTPENETCVSNIWLVGAGAPVVIFLIIYFLNPSFVNSKNEKGQEEQSITKVIIWTTVFSLLVWGGLYGYNLYTKA